MRDDKKADRAGQIEAAAYAILEEKGFAGLSVQAVAKRARASNETIYKWYGDKTGLFEALIRRNSGLVEAAIGASHRQTAADRLAEIGPVLLTMLLGPRAIALNRAAASDPTGTLGRALAREGRETIAPRVVALMQDAVHEGSLEGAQQEIAETWFSLLIGDLQVRRVTGALSEPRADYITARAATALARLRQLYPPRRLDATPPNE